MHIAEGILPITWTVATTAAALPFIARGARQMEEESAEDRSIRPVYGLIGAAVFVISAIPVPMPFAGTSSHATGIALAAILLKPYPAVAVTAVILIMQAFFMGHGGITSWGANTLHMGVAGAFAAYFIFQALRRMRLPLWASAAAAGVTGNLATYALTSLTLGLSLHGDASWQSAVSMIFLAFMPTQLPILVAEAVLTAGIVTFIVSRRPDIAIRLKIIPSLAPSEPRLRVQKQGLGWLWAAAALIPALVVVADTLVDRLAGGGPDASSLAGLEERLSLSPITLPSVFGLSGEIIFGGLTVVLLGAILYAGSRWSRKKGLAAAPDGGSNG